MKTFQQTLNLLNRRLNARNALMMRPLKPTVRLPVRTIVSVATPTKTTERTR
jgi:hypothetical protein